MKFEKITIQNIRGIRTEITFEPGGENMVIFGNNGTGKSAVVDAIDFLLTGNISRISGEGTGSITLSKHGAHIDLENIAEAYVVAEVRFPMVDETILLQRNMAQRHQLDYDSKYQSLIEPVLTLALNGHHILNRRKILELIISQPKNRASKISSLLSLSNLESFRSDMFRINNQYKKEMEREETLYHQQKHDLLSFLQKDDCSSDTILETVNKFREGLGARPLDRLNPDDITRGIALVSPKEEEIIQIPVSFESDINVFESCLVVDIEKEFGRSIEYITEYYKKIHEAIDSALIEKQLRFYQFGMDLIDEANVCPLCGHKWDDITIQEIIENKLLQSTELKTKFESCQTAEMAIKERIDLLPKRINRMSIMAEDGEMPEVKAFLIDWRTTIDEFDFQELRDNLTSNHISELLHPEGLSTIIKTLRKYKEEFTASETPEENIFRRLISIENAYKAYQEAEIAFIISMNKKAIANSLYENFNRARDAVLDDLYDEIKDTFSEFYKFLNNEDESDFSSNFKHEESSFDIEVEFMGRGMHPPHALHSEGHQDSMGVCLFLALNQHLSSKQLGFVVLDDVIMAVDLEHRRSFCDLIKEKFKDYQFFITTCDFVWANQLQSAGVVRKKNMLKFLNWDINTGPMMTESQNVFEKIQEYIEQGDIPIAAAVLRREFEMRMNILADYLCVKVNYRMDNKYSLFDFMPGVYDQYKNLFIQAINSAQSLGLAEQKIEIIDRKNQFAEKFDEIHKYIKDVHSQVHYTNWSQFNKNDFQPVFEIFRTYLELISCPDCHGSLLVSSRRENIKFLDCACGSIHWNLNNKI